MKFTDEDLWKFTAIMSGIGILLATYLLYNFYAVKPSTICNLSASVNCDAITKGSISTFFGVPVSLVGLSGYAIILFSSLTKKKELSLFMSTFGMIFCLRLTILELFFVKVICPVCVLCQTVMLLVFLASTTLYFRKK